MTQFVCVRHIKTMSYTIQLIIRVMLCLFVKTLKFIQRWARR